MNITYFIQNISFPYCQLLVKWYGQQKQILWTKNWFEVLSVKAGKYILKYIFRGGGGKSLLLFCGVGGMRCLIQENERAEVITVGRQSVKSRLFWHVAYHCWDHRVRFCLQLLLKDLGCRRAAVNPAFGPGRFDMSKFPLSSVAQLWEKCTTVAKPHQWSNWCHH